jgi:hypothetical protein
VDSPYQQITVARIASAGFSAQEYRDFQALLAYKNWGGDLKLKRGLAELPATYQLEVRKPFDEKWRAGFNSCATFMEYAKLGGFRALAGYIGDAAARALDGSPIREIYNKLSGEWARAKNAAG